MNNILLILCHFKENIPGVCYIMGRAVDGLDGKEDGGGNEVVIIWVQTLRRVSVNCLFWIEKAFTANYECSSF